jgi:hypothetical protein
VDSVAVVNVALAAVLDYVVSCYSHDIQYVCSLRFIRLRTAFGNAGKSKQKNEKTRGKRKENKKREKKGWERKPSPS